MEPPSDLSPPMPMPAGTPAAVAPAPSDGENYAIDDNVSGCARTLTLAPPPAQASSAAPSSNKSKKQKRRNKRDENTIWTHPAPRRPKKKPAVAAAAHPVGSSAHHYSSSMPNNDVPVVEAGSLLVPAGPRLAAERADDSPDQPVLLSRVSKSERIELSADRLAAGGTKGYRMVRATRGVAAGAWYFEVRVLHLGPTGHTRLGWATDRADLQLPVGADAYGFGYRDMDGAKVHKAWRDDYGDRQGYGEGDVVGFYISLPDGERFEPKQPELIVYKGKPFYVQAPKEKLKTPPPPVPGSEICYFKNGVCQGSAFKDIPGGRYYPAASLYTMPNEPNCVVKFNFGPDFEFFPQDFDGLPVPQPMSEVSYQMTSLEVKNEGPGENGIAEIKKLAIV